MTMNTKKLIIKKNFMFSSSSVKETKKETYKIDFTPFLVRERGIKLLSCKLKKGIFFSQKKIDKYINSAFFLWEHSVVIYLFN